MRFLSAVTLTTSLFAFAQAPSDGGTALSGTWWVERANRGPIAGFVAPSSFAPLVKAVRSGVVVVTTRNAGTSRSLGSGFVVTARGLVITNEHVIRNAQRVFVRLFDSREFEATVLGKDQQLDLAVLQLEGKSVFPVLPLGDSDAMQVGDWVVAIGAPFQLDASVTQGIVSARERSLHGGTGDDFLQVNVQINPGNSGGPLFNMKGEVVGVTTSVIAESQGIGFAVPINLLKDVLPNLVDNGKLDRGWMGLTVQEEHTQGKVSVVVAAVSQDSPAAKAGIIRNDKLIAIGGKPVLNYQQAVRRIVTLSPGAQVKLKLQRGNAVFEAAVTLTTPKVRVTRPFEGLGVEVYAEDGVLRVAQVTTGAVGERAGFAVGDEIEALNGQILSSLEEFGLALAASSNELIIRIRHLGVSKTIGVRLNRAP